MLEDKLPQEETIPTTESKPIEKSGFLNPFELGVTYTDFLESVKKSKKTIAEYCKDKITADELAWLSIEIEHFKNNQKN